MKSVEGQIPLFNNTDFLSYQIIRSKKRKRTMTLKIERDGTVVIMAPERTPKEEINRFFRSKTGWIEKKLKEYKELPGVREKQRRYVAGEKFFYLGEEFPLEVVEGGRKRLTLSHGIFRLSSGQNVDRKAIFREWYKAQAREIFTERVDFYSKQFGLLPKGIKITTARTRYGSCSSDNRLSFSYRLVMAPYRIIDYIIVHELAHIKVKNHSKKFWEYLEKLMPDYLERRSWLKERGHLLDI